MDVFFKITFEQELNKSHFTQKHISWHLRTIFIY